MDTIVGLKVDIDTYEGGFFGIPNLINLFKKLNVKASFFGVMGPDNSGRAAFRVFTQKGFLKKMLRTKAPKIYGIKTMLYGVLLPGPSMPKVLRDKYKMIVDFGFEFGVHGYDHIAWHNNLCKWDKQRIKSEYEKIFEAYYNLMNFLPSSVATPGWQESCKHIEVVDSFEHIKYRSDTRFSQPFFASCNGKISPKLEIPTTFHSLDELLGRKKNEDEILSCLLNEVKKGEVNVFTLHTELEGRFYLEFLKKFIISLKERFDAKFLTLGEISEKFSKTNEIRNIYMGTVDGRAGQVALSERFEK